MTFQRAPPEVNGFGVITSTPSSVRSSHVGDPLGVALADGEDDDGVGDHPLVLGARPARVDEARLDETLHVRRERERHDVGAEARLDGPALLAGAAVGLVERHALAGRRLCELLRELLVRLAGSGVRDEGQLVALRARGRAATGCRSEQQGRRGECEQQMGRAGDHDAFLSRVVDNVYCFCKLSRH